MYVGKEVKTFPCVQVSLGILQGMVVVTEITTAQVSVVKQFGIMPLEILIPKNKAKLLN